MTVVQCTFQREQIVDFFKNKLKDLKFISPEDYKQIESWLSSLCDTTKKRYEKTHIAWDVWQFFFEKSLRALTDNVRGHDKLYRYLNEYMEYENLLFAIDRKYRDHMIHSIWVMLLGFYLKDKYHQFNDMDYMNIFLLCDDVKCLEEYNTVKKIIKEKEDPLWCLIALTHDLGYPIERTKRANEVMTKMINNFGFLKQKDFDYNFTTVHEPVINELLNILSYQLIWRPNSWTIGYASGTRADHAKSFERLDHGIMAAYLLQMYLDWIFDDLNIRHGTENIYPLKNEDAARMTYIITLLDAISAHTNKNRYVKMDTVNEMQTLLFLSDELDELSRFSRSKTDEWIEINCKTEFEWTNEVFQINYTFDESKDYDVVEFFKGKVDKLNDRFEIGNTKSLKLSLNCKGTMSKKSVVCKYEKTSSSCFVIINDKTYRDMYEFLSGR